MKQEKIPLIDCPIDYIFGDASGKILNEYGRFPCKIQCAVYAFMIEGSATATLDITQYHFQRNDLVYLKPGSFFLVHEFSEDARVAYIVFSSSFMDKHAYGARRIVSNRSLNPIIHVNEEQAGVINNFSDLLHSAINCTPSMLSSERMMYVFHLIHQTYAEMCASSEAKTVHAQDRKAEIYHEYNDLVLKHYHEWHHVQEYAEAMCITVPHLCSTIKIASGRTAGEIIVDAILMDAKAQLKISTLPIKEIAANLGFDNVAFFNRFFKSHVGLTPKVYRNS